MHDFNLPGGFYLAKADENGDSMWFKARQHMKETGVKLDCDEDPWLTGTRQYFDVDFEKHRIYLVDSVEDLVTFFARYGTFTQKLKVMYNVCDYQKYKKLAAADRMRIKKYKLLRVLNDFLDNLEDASILTSSKFEIIKEQRNQRNMPLVNFQRGHLVPHKPTLQYLVDVVRTKEAFERIVGNLDPSLIQTSLESINYPLLRQDGYNGVYYSTNIIKIADVDIPYFPDVLGDTSEKDLKFFRNQIAYYMKWLLTDTLILWKWVF